MAVRRGGHVLELRDQPQPPPPLLRRAPPHPGALIDEPLLLRRAPALPPQLHPAAAAALEDRLAAQHRNIQALLLDNQRFAATHVALRQELDASRHELRVAAAAAARARAERDAEVRGVFERSLRVEAEARGVEGMRAELDHVRGDVQRLAAARDEHLDRLQGLKAELARARAEIAQVSALRSEIEAMQREIQKGRAAVEFEKKAHAENLEQRYVVTYGNPEMVYRGSAYGGNTYADAYNMHQVQMGGAEAYSQYGSLYVSQAPYGAQQTQEHK
ncbi:Protein FLX-like 1 [Ananas comosus]|uniref:Protein FLX-like 1 n=1 Tax=Ananas comosus TaxID=4615 RepID=A0A199UWN7_ANACO|nr:Protein FLX-like 1 [Ananas comosus]